MCLTCGTWPVNLFFMNLFSTERYWESLIINCIFVIATGHYYYDWRCLNRARLSRFRLISINKAYIPKMHHNKPDFNVLSVLFCRGGKRGIIGSAILERNGGLDGPWRRETLGSEWAELGSGLMTMAAGEEVAPMSASQVVLRNTQMARSRPNSLLGPEREPIKFQINLVGAPPEVEQLVDHVKNVAEQFLYHWKTFPIGK